MSSVALLLATHTSFAAITSGKPADIPSSNYFTVAANGANCDITGIYNSSAMLGSGVAGNNATAVYCTGDGTPIGSTTTNCASAKTSAAASITKPTTTLNVGALYFKQVSGTFKRYPGWFTLDSSCNATNFYYDNVLDATIVIGQTSSTTVNAPIDLYFSKQVETFATEIEVK